ncbi:MAG: hypothetical protein HQK51_19940, partial [Oligoflexia bacterium]|nr:hypothetical protein [Oligoflexia bacterium]
MKKHDFRFKNKTTNIVDTSRKAKVKNTSNLSKYFNTRRDEIILSSLLVLMLSIFFVVYFKFNDKYIKLTVVHTDVLFGQIFP